MAPDATELRDDDEAFNIDDEMEESECSCQFRARPLCLGMWSNHKQVNDPAKLPLLTKWL